MATVRWVFTDAVADEAWVVPINPDSMTPFDVVKPRPMRHGNGFRRDRRIRTFVEKPTTMEWSFGGVIRTEAHYNEMLRWVKKTNDVTIVDHTGQTFRVYLTDFEPEDRKPTRRTSWRLRYTVKAVLLEVPS